MGLGPREADALTLAEMRLLVRAWNEAHGSEEDEAPPPPSADDYYEMLELVGHV